jgi:hypothetical protein
MVAKSKQPAVEVAVCEAEITPYQQGGGLVEEEEDDVILMGIYHISNPFSNSYSINSMNPSNLKWSSNFALNPTQGAPPKYSKFPAKESLSN